MVGQQGPVDGHRPRSGTPVEDAPEAHQGAAGRVVQRSALNRRAGQPHGAAAVADRDVAAGVGAGVGDR